MSDIKASDHLLGLVCGFFAIAALMILIVLAFIVLAASVVFWPFLIVGACIWWVVDCARFIWSRT